MGCRELCGVHTNTDTNTDTDTDAIGFQTHCIGVGKGKICVGVGQCEHIIRVEDLENNLAVVPLIMPGCWFMSRYHGYRTTCWRTSITTRRRRIHRAWVSLTSTIRGRHRSGHRGNSANRTCHPSTCPYCTNTATETVRVIVGIIICDLNRSCLIDLKPAFRLIFWTLHLCDHDSTWKLVIAGTISFTQVLIRTVLRQTF